MEINSFLSRHLGPKAEETAKMLKIIGVSSLDELIDQTIPSKIRLKQPLSIGNAIKPELTILKPGKKLENGCQLP